MKLDNVEYIVKDLITKGLVSLEDKDKVTEVISAQGKTNKEYQIKQWILYYLEFYSNSLIKESDVNEVFSTINCKYKEDFVLEKEHIRFDVLNYLKKNKNMNNVKDEKLKLSNLLDEFFKTCHVIEYKTLFK